jgi:hypothetical protein
MKTRRPKPTLQAKSVSTNVCAHGSVHIHMHDARGDVFASACLPIDTFHKLADNVLDGIDEYAAGLIGKCEEVH